MIKTIFNQISIWIIILPLLAGFINYRGLNKDSRWIFLLVWVALVPQVLTAIIGKETSLLHVSYNVYTPIEFGILYILFREKLNEGIHKKIVYVSLGLYIVISLVIMIREGLSNSFLNSLACVNNVIYMVWILLILKEQYNVEDFIIRKSNPFAWYLLAILIYAPCSLIALALYYYIRNPLNPVLLNLWIIQSVCNILLYILFSVGLFLRRQT